MNISVNNSATRFERRPIRDLKDMVYTSCSLYKDNNAYQYRDTNGSMVSKTYKEVLEDVNALGTAFMSMGLRNKKISIIGENSYKWAISYLATVCGVGTVTPLDKALTEKEIENLLIESGAEAILFAPKYTEMLQNIKQRGNVNLSKYICFDIVSDQSIEYFDNILKQGRKLIKNGDKNYIDSVVYPEEPNVLLFTSGTTTKSKGVLLTHENICINLMSVASVIEYRQDDIWLSNLPIHHIYESILGFLQCFYNGSCLAFCEGTRYIMRDLKDFKITMFACVPLMLEKIYKNIIKEQEKINEKITKEKLIEMLGGHLRFILVGAASVSENVVSAFRESNIDICQAYGMTESSSIISCETLTTQKSGSVGYAIPQVELKIDNPDENGLGEILARSKVVTKGYYQNEEETNKILKDGWYYTGDLGYVDNDGFLFVSGRKKSVIVLKNGKIIFPEEIEVRLNQNPCVNESFIYGVSRGEGKDTQVCCKIVYNEQVISANYGDIPEEKIYEIMDEFRKEINDTLPRYKQITKLIITKEPLIKTTTNKIKRSKEMEKMGLQD